MPFNTNINCFWNIFRHFLFRSQRVTVGFDCPLSGTWQWEERNYGRMIIRPVTELNGEGGRRSGKYKPDERYF